MSFESRCLRIKSESLREALLGKTAENTVWDRGDAGSQPSYMHGPITCCPRAVATGRHGLNLDPSQTSPEQGSSPGQIWTFSQAKTLVTLKALCYSNSTCSNAFYPWCSKMTVRMLWWYFSSSDSMRNSSSNGKYLYRAYSIPGSDLRTIKLILKSQFCKWGNWGLQRWSNLPKVIGPVDGRA